MEPIPKKIMCIIACKNLPNVSYNDGEIFVHAMHRNGNYINYAVSNYGRIYSFYRNKICKQYIDDRGYCRINVHLGVNQTSYIGVHYLELMSFKPINNTDLYVPNHIDGNPRNNVLWNLEWNTISENTRHALATGLADCKGENNSRSILTNDTVKEICSYLENGQTISEIADHYVDAKAGKEREKIMGAIRNIRRGQTYLDISRNYNIKGINGKVNYEPEITKEICDILSQGSISIIDLCDHFNIPLEDRKMFCNYVRDITRGAKHTYIFRNYPKLYPVKAVPYTHPDYEWYY